MELLEERLDYFEQLVIPGEAVFNLGKILASLREIERRRKVKQVSEFV